MAEIRRSKAADGRSLRLIAKRLREDGETVTQEPLPERWVDLIRHLNEQERKQAEAIQAEFQSKRVLNTELFNEILDTNEPTARTRALLEGFRRVIERPPRN